MFDQVVKALSADAIAIVVDGVKKEATGLYQRANADRVLPNRLTVRAVDAMLVRVEEWSKSDYPFTSLAGEDSFSLIAISYFTNPLPTNAAGPRNASIQRFSLSLIHI